MSRYGGRRVGDRAGVAMASGMAPLRNRVFRNLFIAQMVSNIGLWMQTVGAQWFLVDQHAGPTVISLVQTASLLPTLLLSLVAGVLADVLNRKWLLVVMSAYATVVAGVMAVLAAVDLLDPGMLLVLTFLLGAGSALSAPAFQAVNPEIVPREQIADAASLGSMSINVARAVGPALAGVLFTVGGAGVVFAINAVSYLAVVVALLRWRRPADTSTMEPEHLGTSMVVGLRYVAAAPIVRRILVRSALFAFPASALWALLPLVVSNSFHFGSTGYGVVLGVLGCGAILGVLGLPWMRDHLSPNVILASSAVVFAVGTVAAALGSTVVALIVFVPAGVAWIATLSTLNAEMQLTLPAWVRARGMAAYLLVFMGSQGIGSLVWGALGGLLTVRWALLIAALALILAALAVAVLPIHAETGTLDRTLSTAWPEPMLVFEPAPDDGPVRVVATYRVDAEHHDEFVDAMAGVALSRRRTGARNWHLYRNGEDSDDYVEQFVVGSWSEYQRQRTERWTEYDHQRVSDALALTVDGRSRQEHLFTLR